MYYIHYVILPIWVFASFAYHHGQVFVVSTDGRKKFPSSSIISCTCLLPEIELRFMTCSSERKKTKTVIIIIVVIIMMMMMMMMMMMISIIEDISNSNTPSLILTAYSSFLNNLITFLCTRAFSLSILNPKISVMMDTSSLYVLYLIFFSARSARFQKIT